MENLIKILSKHEVKDFEAAEMIYAYLIEYGDSEDHKLMDELYKLFLTRSDVS